MERMNAERGRSRNEIEAERNAEMWAEFPDAPAPEPPPYTGDEPLGTCVIHGDYWTDDCLRCRGER